MNDINNELCSNVNDINILKKDIEQSIKNAVEKLNSEIHTFENDWYMNERTIAAQCFYEIIKKMDKFFCVSELKNVLNISNQKMEEKASEQKEITDKDSGKIKKAIEKKNKKPERAKTFFLDICANKDSDINIVIEFKVSNSPKKDTEEMCYDLFKYLLLENKNKRNLFLYCVFFKNNDESKIELRSSESFERIKEYEKKQDVSFWWLEKKHENYNNYMEKYTRLFKECIYLKSIEDLSKELKEIDKERANDYPLSEKRLYSEEEIKEIATKYFNDMKIFVKTFTSKVVRKYIGEYKKNNKEDKTIPNSKIVSKKLEEIYKIYNNERGLNNDIAGSTATVTTKISWIVIYCLANFAKNKKFEKDEKILIPIHAALEEVKSLYEKDKKSKNSKADLIKFEKNINDPKYSIFNSEEEVRAWTDFLIDFYRDRYIWDNASQSFESNKFNFEKVMDKRKKASEKRIKAMVNELSQRNVLDNNIWNALLKLVIEDISKNNN